MEPVIFPSEALPESHIQPGNYIWYGGQTSMFGWDCPAMIMVVDQVTRTFTVMSLDDLKHQSQVYTFDILEHSPASRRSMRAITREEAAQYIHERIVEAANVETAFSARVAELRAAVDACKKRVDRWTEMVREIEEAK